LAFWFGVFWFWGFGQFVLGSNPGPPCAQQAP
jgi:hypothetical protein